MTTYNLQAPMPAIRLASGMKLKLEAIDPTTGAAVTGVVATDWAIYGENVSGETGALEDIVPRLTREEVETWEA